MNPQLERAAQAFNAGAWNEARALCRDQLLRTPDDPDALVMLGHIEAASGEPQAAYASLLRARAAAPADAFFLTSLGAAFSLAGAESEARAAFEAALKLDPGLPRALHGLGDILFRHGDWNGARALFERTLQRRADFAPALASLADLALRDHRDADAETLAQRALAANPNLPGAHLVLAELALVRRAAAETLAAAERAVASRDTNAQQRGRALTLRAQALEALGRYDDAFAAFESSNLNARHAAASVDFANHPLTPDRLEGFVDFLNAQDSSAWPRAPADTRPAPVFLVGFPRSGTTLLGQILGAHPEIETMEEGDRFADAVAALLADIPVKPWQGLTPADLARLRAGYWSRVDQHLGRAPAKPIVIDKMPMNLILLPIIQLLFPGAKVLFALRDPRDVVMSCFRQRFELNRATVHFLSLPETVAFYDLSMRVAAAARAQLPLDIHEVRYERVVGDFEAEIGAALAFIGAPWNDAVLGYARSARDARILTPSARAVTQPITASAAGAWRKYERQLAPHLPLLEQWAARLRA